MMYWSYQNLLVLGLVSLPLTLGCSNPRKPAPEAEPVSSTDDATAQCGACTEPSFCLGAHCVSAGSPVVNAPQGTAMGELGSHDAEEAAPQMPRSFTVSEDERSLWILDAENVRIQLFRDGKAKQLIPLPSRFADDMVRLDSGKLVVLDWQNDKLWLLDADGQVLSSSSVTGFGVERPSEIASLFLRPSGVWGDKPRGKSVLLLEPEGQAVGRRKQLPGKLSRDERLLMSAESLDDGTVHLNVREPTGTALYRDVQLKFEHRAGVYFVDTDAAGRLYLFTSSLWRDDSGAHLEYWRTVLADDLSELRRERLSVAQSSRSPTRAFFVTGSGASYQLLSEPDHDNASVEATLVRRF